MAKKNKVKNTMELIHQTTGVKIAFCYGRKAYSEYFKAQFGLDEHIAKDACSTEVTNDNTGKYAIVVGIKEHSNAVELKGLLVHELSHTVSQLMQEFGFVCCEFRSYTLQWLYQEIVPSLDARLLKDAIKRDKKDQKTKRAKRSKKRCKVWQKIN